MRNFVAALLFCAGLCAGLSAPPAAVAAQGRPAISMDARAGFDRAYRPAEWFPIVVTLSNDGPDLRAVLEWDFPDLPHEMAFRRTIDLPSGARKRVTLQAFARASAQGGRLRLLDGDATLAEQILPLEPIPPNDFLLGVVSSDPTLLGGLSSLSIGPRRTNIRRFDLSAVPDQAAALRSLNALALHNVDTRALTSAQRDALALWVGLGGQLVVSGGLGAQQTAAGLADLLPVALGGVGPGDLTPLGSFARTSPPDPASAPLSEARPLSGTEQLPPNSGLLFRRGVGGGAVVFSAFDLAALRGWDGEPALWRELLLPAAIFAPGTNARRDGDNLLRDVLQLPARALPSSGTLLILLIVYILAVGPLNYLVLRRLRRLEWAWVSIPAAALICAAGLYVAGLGLRGGQAQVEQAAIVQAAEGQPRAFATAFVGLFSPRRASYTLAFPPAALVGEARESSDTLDASLSPLRDDARVTAPNALVDVGEVRTLVAEVAVDLPLSVQSDLREQDGALKGEIRNTGAQPIDEALIVRGGSFQQLGSIAPGTSQRVVMDAGAKRFPWSSELSPVGPFNRQKLLVALFGTAPPRPGAPAIVEGAALDPQSAYLLAWSAQPSVATQLDGQAATQEALTLYVIRLKTGGS